MCTYKLDFTFPSFSPERLKAFPTCLHSASTPEVIPNPSCVQTHLSQIWVVGNCLTVPFQLLTWHCYWNSNGAGAYYMLIVCFAELHHCDLLCLTTELDLEILKCSSDFPLAFIWISVQLSFFAMFPPRSREQWHLDCLFLCLTLSLAPTHHVWCDSAGKLWCAGIMMFECWLLVCNWNTGMLSHCPLVPAVPLIQEQWFP